MAGVPAFCSERIQASLAAAGDGAALIQLRQSAAADGGALVRLGGTEHVDIAAAADVPRLCVVAARQIHQHPDRRKLGGVMVDGTGIVPDKGAGDDAESRCKNVGRIPHPRQAEGVIDEVVGHRRDQPPTQKAPGPL